MILSYSNLILQFSVMIKMKFRFLVMAHKCLHQITSPISLDTSYLTFYNTSTFLVHSCLRASVLTFPPCLECPSPSCLHNLFSIFKSLFKNCFYQVTFPTQHFQKNAGRLALRKGNRTLIYSFCQVPWHTYPTPTPSWLISSYQSLKTCLQNFLVFHNKLLEPALAGPS